MYPKTRLSNEEVHLWLAPLYQASARIEALRFTLSANEVYRAERFRLVEDRDRFIVSRGLLRTILGRYISIPPEALEFSYGPHGKPALADKFSKDKIQFNLSHSHDLAIYIIAGNRSVGVDLEQIRPIPEARQLIDRFFSAQEKAALRALPREEQSVAFFRYWIHKEAYIKATGLGFAMAPDSFSVSITDKNPFRLLVLEGEPKESKRWSFGELRPSPDVVAAFAVEGRDWRLSCWRFGAEIPIGYNCTAD